MADELEGGIISLDAHTDELLRSYVAEHNRWLCQLPSPDGCPYPPSEISFEAAGRLILARFLQEWADRRKDAVCSPATVQAPHASVQNVHTVLNGSNAGSRHRKAK